MVAQPNGPPRRTPPPIRAEGDIAYRYGITMWQGYTSSVRRGVYHILKHGFHILHIPYDQVYEVYEIKLIKNHIP